MSDKKERVEIVQGQPHPKQIGFTHRPFDPQIDSEDTFTDLGSLKNYYHPTMVAEGEVYGNLTKIGYKHLSPGDSTLLNHTALIASVRAMEHRRATKKDRRYTTDDAIAAGELEEYLRDVKNEQEYIFRVIAGGVVFPAMTWEDVPEALDDEGIADLYPKILGGAVPSTADERTERFPAKNGTRKTRSKPKTSSG